ncbi:MAG: hypothetical protein AAGD38_11860 [Acidobacteriota bacterium]
MARPLVTSAGCLLNLMATGRVTEVLDALGVRLLAPRAVRSEPLALGGRDDELTAPTLDPIDLRSLESTERLVIEGLDAAELREAWVACSEQLHDQDAATVALAAVSGIPLATDDRRQIAVAIELFPDLEIVSTLELLADAAERLALDESELDELLRRVRVRAAFLPARDDRRRDWLLDRKPFESDVEFV